MVKFINSNGYASSFWQNVHTWFTQQLNDQKPKGTIATLDGIRALAFLLVFTIHVNHADVWSDGKNPYIAALFAIGRTGVTLFFILSGFLLFLPYTQALLFGKDWPQAKIYYIRRVLRIFPGYFFSLFILVMFKASYLIQPHNWKLLLPFLTFTMGYTLSESVNGPYWTLAVEFQYYLLLPLISFGILRLTRLVRPEKRLWMVVGSLFAIMIWGLTIARDGPYLFNHPEALPIPHVLSRAVAFVIYGDHGKFLEFFACGMLIAVSYLSIMNSSRKELYLLRIRRFLLVLLIPCIVLFIYSGMPDTPLPFVPYRFQFRHIGWINEFMFCLYYSYLVSLVLVARPDRWLVRIFSWTPLRWLGLISFSLYIWHRPLVQILAANLRTPLQHLNPVLTVSLFWLISSVVVVTFCFVLFVLIEKPGMQLSDKLRQRIVLQQAAKRQAMLDSVHPYSHIQTDLTPSR